MGEQRLAKDQRETHEGHGHHHQAEDHHDLGMGAPAVLTSQEAQDDISGITQGTQKRIGDGEQLRDG